MSSRRPSRAEVTARTLEEIHAHPEDLLDEYQRRFGHVLNADNAAELFPDYAASAETRTRYRTAIHPAAQWIRDELFNRALADPHVKEVVFTAGGNGAGKTSMVLTGDLVMDTTLSNPGHSQMLIQSALDLGKRVQVVYVFRSIEDAFQGVLDRAQTEGRTVSIGTTIKTHEGAARTVQQLYEIYAGNPDVDFQFIDNSAPRPTLGTVALVRKQNYLGSREQLHAILDSRRSQLSPSVYKASKGTGSQAPGAGTGATGDR
jgi:hypothetical protein